MPKSNRNSVSESQKAAPSKDSIAVSRFRGDQQDIVFKTLVFQNLCPGKFLLHDPWPYDELDDDGVDNLRNDLTSFMPLDTMVTDMWDWDIQFQDITFEDSFFDVALGPEEYALSEASNLSQDILNWISEYGMDYAEEQWSRAQFEKWIYEQCVEFIEKWRHNIVKKFA